MVHALDDPAGLSLRAQKFLATFGTRTTAPSADEQRAHWRSYQVPEAGVELAAAYQDRWGGLVLPETAHYDGGPACLSADMPTQHDGFGWCITAGPGRDSVPYGFYVDQHGRFGVSWTRRVPLHGSVEGWVEACALEHAATDWDLVARRTGDLRELMTTWVPRVGPLTPVPEVHGLADAWLRGDGVMVWICTGEYRLFADEDDAPQAEAVLYAIS